MKTARKSIPAFALGWLALSAHIACADFTVLWTVGEKNHNMEEFDKSNNGNRDSEPGSATALDDHYYIYLGLTRHRLVLSFKMKVARTSSRAS